MSIVATDNKKFTRKQLIIKHTLSKFLSVMSRFGIASAVDIDKNTDNLMPTNTRKSKTLI